MDRCIYNLDIEKIRTKEYPNLKSDLPNAFTLNCPNHLLEQMLPISIMEVPRCMRNRWSIASQRILLAIYSEIPTQPLHHHNDLPSEWKHRAPVCCIFSRPIPNISISSS